MREPTKTLAGFLEPYDRNVVDLAMHVRDFVMDEAPDATEIVYDAFNSVATAYSFTGDIKDAFCHVAVYSSHVTLGSNEETVRIDSVVDIVAPPVRDLLKRAISNATR